MPKRSAKMILNLNLLKPQSNPETIWVKLFRWLLSSGRLIIVFVELLVLTAFVVRFKLDADIASLNEAIEQETPFIESLRRDENIIRRTQLQLATVKDIRQSSIDFVATLQAISDQTPLGTSLETLSIDKIGSELNVKINGKTRNHQELTSFITGLRSAAAFSSVTLNSISIERDLIVFTLTASGQVKSGVRSL